jgi:hypothetical protein
MKKLMIIAAVAAMTMATGFAPKPALADNGRIAAGVVGGLAVGAIVGSQLNRHDDGYRHRSRVRYRECRIERHDWEDRRGRLHVRRVRVCD